MHSTRNDLSENTGTTELHEAAKWGEYNQALDLKEKRNDEFLKFLIKADYNGDLPLDRAAARGHYNIVEMLINAHSLPNCSYHGLAKNNYTPFLSAVRWYCKVLDGTYTRGGVTGKFNTVVNDKQDYKKDYINIIKLLIQRFPQHISKADDKGLNAMHYAVMHLNHAMDKTTNQKVQNALIELVKLLRESGLSFHMGVNSGPSPISHASARIKYTLEGIDSTVARKEKEKEAASNAKAARSKTNSELEKYTYKEYSYDYDLVPQVDTITVKSGQEDKLVSDEEDDLADPQINSTKSRQKKTSATTHQKQARPIDFSELANLIFKKFQKNTNYQARTPSESQFDNAIVSKLEDLLKKSLSPMQIVTYQDQKALVTPLADAIKLQSHTSGFLCCAKTRRWLELDEHVVQSVLNGNHSYMKKLS
jgi:Ankyrin repeats (many copies)